MIESLKYLALLVVSIICFKFSYGFLADQTEIAKILMYIAIPLTLIIHIKSKWFLKNQKISHFLFFVTNVVYLLLIGYFLKNKNIAMLSIYILLLVLSIGRIYFDSKKLNKVKLK